LRMPNRGAMPAPSQATTLASLKKPVSGVNCAGGEGRSSGNATRRSSSGGRSVACRCSRE
jgi:hypothetical protein